VLDVPEAVESLVEYFRSISGEHPDWDEYRQAMVRQASPCCASRPRAVGRWRLEASPPGSRDRLAA
jgi:hypothetical protein